MQDEVEAKFLNLSHNEIRDKLKALGATCEVPMRLMRRTLFDYPDRRLQKNNWGRVRVRDEGNKITISYKQGGEAEYSKEVETSIGSYEKMLELLTEVGLVAYCYEESKRETWQYKGVEIVLDEWPWLSPYIEIEGPDESSIKKVAAALNLDWNDAAFGNVDTAYRRQYPKMSADDTIGSIPELKFEGSLPAWFQERT